MNNFLAGKKTLYIIVLFVVIVGLLIGATYFLQNRLSPQTNTTTQVPTPTTFIPEISGQPNIIPAESEEYKKSVEIIHKSEETFVQREGAVGRLLNFLPHTGTNFRMEHNYETMQYVVTIDKENESAGREEFISFLKQNNVEQAWIRSDLLLIRVE